MTAEIYSFAPVFAPEYATVSVLPLTAVVPMEKLLRLLSFSVSFHSLPVYSEICVKASAPAAPEDLPPSAADVKSTEFRFKLKAGRTHTSKMSTL